MRSVRKEVAPDIAKDGMRHLWVAGYCPIRKEFMIASDADKLRPLRNPAVPTIGNATWSHIYVRIKSGES